MVSIYPTSVYAPRTKTNLPGVIYDPAQPTIGYAEDVTKLDAEVVGISADLVGTGDPAGLKKGWASFDARFPTGWTTWSPVLFTSPGSTVPTYQVISARYKVIDKIVFFNFKIQSTDPGNAGIGNGYVFVTVPVAGNQSVFISGGYYNNYAASMFVSLGAWCSGDVMQFCFSPDPSYHMFLMCLEFPVHVSWTLNFSGFYEIA